MHSLSSVKRAVQGETFVTVAREGVWRARRLWNRNRLAPRLKRPCPVEFCPRGFRNFIDRLMGPGDKVPVLAAADAVCRGEFRFLGYPDLGLGLPPRWNEDFVTGKQWPDEDSKAICLLCGDGSDVKAPWELSRLQFLPVLARAHRLTRETRYRRCAMELAADWIEWNPPGIGVNWAVAMEAALRGISLALTVDALWPFDSSERRWAAQVEHSLWQHMLFIEAHNEFSHLCRSNHYLSDIAGLFCICMFLQGDGIEGRRRSLADALEAEIRHQVLDDGGDYESSAGYQLLASQLFALPYLLARSAGMDFSPGYVARLGRMFDWMETVADAHGALPHLGDCDDGRVELLEEDLAQMMRPVPQRHSLSIGSWLKFGRWLRGAANVEGRSRVRLLESSGIARAVHAGAEVLFFAMPNSIGGKGGHGHNDKLSFVLRVAGNELFCDSGTGCYGRSPALRNELRATSAHNTLTVDGEEQNRFDPAASQLFRIGNDAVATPIRLEESDTSIRMCAEHSGYKRIGVIHARTLELRTSELLIEDVLQGQGQHRFELSFQLPVETRDVEVTQSEAGQPVCRAAALHMLEVRPTTKTTLVMRRQPSVISRAYGATASGTRIAVTGHGTLPLRIVTRVSWEIES